MRSERRPQTPPDPEGAEGQEERHEPSAREKEEDERPEEIELLLDRERPEVRHRVWIREVMPDIDVRAITEQPRPDLPNLSDARDEQNEEHRVVDREDPQKAPRVELAHEHQTAARIMRSELAPVDQDARDEKSAQDEEEPDAEGAPVEPPDDERMRGRLPVVDDDHPEHGEESKRVELRHVAALAGRRRRHALRGTQMIREP